MEKLWKIIVEKEWSPWSYVWTMCVLSRELHCDALFCCRLYSCVCKSFYCTLLIWTRWMNSAWRRQNVSSSSLVSLLLQHL